MTTPSSTATPDGTSAHPTPGPTPPSTPTAVAPATPSTPGAPTPVVMGDGTTARGRARGRWHRLRWPAGVLVLAVLLAVAATLPEPPRSTVAFAPDNPDSAGARAVAQILGREGVTVEYVRRTSEAVAAAARGGTLLVTGTGLLTTEQVDALAATDNDLVLLDPDAATLAAVTSAAEPAFVAEREAALRPASCADPDAQAAGAITTSVAGYRALTDAATICFPGDDDPASGAYLVVEEDRRITALADGSLLTNAHLAQDGNAALALRMLGRQDRLVWYVPAFDDLGTDLGEDGAGSSASLTDLLPPSAQVLGLQLLVVALAAAVWRGRRLGPLVTEPLPVVVRAAETTRGRGRLYRRSRAYGHAAAALRAGVASRSAARLGLPRSAGAPAVIDALARATGRTTDDVAALLYGPPPTDDAGLTRLARRLDELESEVHRP